MLRSILFCSFLLFFAELAHQQAATAKEAPLIETTLGRIRGSVMTSRKGRGFYAYRGIYYAKAPTDQRRFAPPEPVEPWNNTLDALADGYTCPQTFPNMGVEGEIERDEDCLSLNVFTANVTASNPVIFYIHGGFNIYGNPHSENRARPHYLLDEDVVVVSVYFRLGAFGFLSTGTPELYGNFGYLDQVLALKWVQQHIENFGGDPNRVTLLGFSAGSAAATAHLISPLSAGLFHGIYALSGSVTGHAEVNNVYWTRKLAHELGCPKFGAQYLLNCLRNFSWQEIVDVSQRWESYGTLDKRWNFEIDGQFLMEHPNEAIRNNRFTHVPIMVGTTRNEHEIKYEDQPIKDNVDLMEDVSENFWFYTNDFFEFQSIGSEDERAKSIFQFYYNTTKINQSNLRTFGTIKSDCIVGHNVHRFLELAMNYTNVYYYRFDYASASSTIPEVSHGSDVSYIFPSMSEVIDDSSVDNLMVDRMTKLVSSFAANGAPPAMDNVSWPPFTATDPVVMYIDKDPYTSGPYYVERYALWDRLFPLKESHAEIQFPAMLLVFFAAVWHRLL